MYSVVLFKETNDIAAVPLTWVHNNNVFWPPHRSTMRVTTAIKNQVESETHWTQYQCAVLSTTASRRMEDTDISGPSAQGGAIELFTIELTGNIARNRCASIYFPSLSVAMCCVAKLADSALTLKMFFFLLALVKPLSELEYVTMQLASHSTILARIEQRMSNVATPIDEPVEPQDMPAYPVQTNDDLERLEASLENKSIFPALVKKLGQIGGSDVATTTKRILKRLIIDEVAVLYSYTGRKGKKWAEKLSTFTLFPTAVRTTRNATDDEISRVIGDWLRFANARLTSSKASKNLISLLPFIEIFEACGH
ncbi:uncharacterized protein LOC119449129 [Dermacentor silvarum]|uniref:uncharacterized protein LOC119449129 n=1 Tax=Dermacentor silvarum TaxID=543639 RepID=UPI002100762C|nr:uncharacterized protein LOC119449129 [Dermacentor silvarum]